MRFALGLALALATSVQAQTPSYTPPAHWSAPQEPFNVAGRLHYVGTAGLSAWLVATPEGHILIDSGLPGSAAGIVRSIETLGFKASDVKVLLNTHAHFDHAGDLAALKQLTGAKMMAMVGDRLALETGRYPGSESVAAFNFAPVKVDRVLKDGDTVTLGKTMLTAWRTPGHSEGCTSWQIEVVVEGVTRTALLHCSSSVAANRLSPAEQYEGIVGDYLFTFRRLRVFKADLFLAPHAEQFGLAEKRARQKRGGPNPFVDPGELPAFAARSEVAFRRELAEQKATPR